MTIRHGSRRQLKLQSSADDNAICTRQPVIIIRSFQINSINKSSNNCNTANCKFPYSVEFASNCTRVHFRPFSFIFVHFLPFSFVSRFHFHPISPISVHFPTIFIQFRSFSFIFDHFCPFSDHIYTISFIFVHFRPFLSIFVRFKVPFSSNFAHFRPFSTIFIQFLPISFLFIHFTSFF